jgi:hypothetical protein
MEFLFGGGGVEDNSNDCITALVFFAYSCSKAEGYVHTVYPSRGLGP